MVFKKKTPEEQDETPAFNSSIAYLETIRWLINTAHVAASNDNDFNDWLRILRQLHIEITPRLKVKQLEHLEELKKSAVLNKNNYGKIEKYHTYLNIYIHSQGLGMINTTIEEAGKAILINR
jgi:hypothetical protein